jgi:hypothetical protein
LSTNFIKVSIFKVTPESQPINLPRRGETDSADQVKSFLNKYFTEALSFPSNEVDSGVTMKIETLIKLVLKLLAQY